MHARDHDPTGPLLRRSLSEPVVAHRTADHHARDPMDAARGTAHAGREAQRVLVRHGGRGKRWA